MTRGKLLFGTVAVAAVVALFVIVLVQSCHNNTPATPVEETEATSSLTVRSLSAWAERAAATPPAQGVAWRAGQPRA